MSAITMLSIAVVAPVAAVITLIGFFALRVDVRALGYWLFGWAAVLAAAAISLGVPEDSALRPVAFLFSSLGMPLMAMGAYAHTDRAVPNWILPSAFLLGVARLSVFQLDFPELSAAIAGASEPAFALLAAATIWRHAERRVDKAAVSERFLIAGFVAIGMLELVDAISLVESFPLDYLWGAWSVLGFPLFSLQISLYIHRLGRDAAARGREADAYARRLKVLTDWPRDIVVEFDEYGTILHVSADLSEMEGLFPDDLIGRDALEFFDFLEGSELATSLRETGRFSEESVLNGPPHVTHDVRPDGSERWFETTATSYRTTSDELRVLTCTRDVTTRLAQETLTRENEQRLRRAERIANLGSWEYFPQERKLLWSEQMFRMHGLPNSSGQVDFELVRSLIHPADFGPLLRAVRRVATGDDIVYRVRRADNGEERSLRTRGEIEFDEDGEPRRISGASLDITEQLDTENRLRRGQAHLRVLIDSNIVGVYCVNEDGRIEEANEAFLSLLGYSKDDLPLDLDELTPVEDVSRHEAARRELERTGITLPYDRDFLARSGERITMLIGCARLEPEIAMVITVDLSERKRAEAYIARHQRELEETIAERTHELMQSRARLIESDRLAAVGTLAAGVAHQINNPIGAILNSAEYALLCRNDEKATAIFEEALQATLSEARRCAQIVKSMLLFSRDEPTAKWIADLNSVVRRANRAITPYATDRSSTVQVQASETAIFVQISPIEIEQAIVNVLRNAIESRDEAASVRLSLISRDKCAEIEILDDGRGISSEDQDHLFEPFFSTRTRDGGTGLGLSVAHGIIVDHGGEIRIESIQGAGTRVLISLPIVDAEAI